MYKILILYFYWFFKRERLLNYVERSNFCKKLVDTNSITYLYKNGYYFIHKNSYGRSIFIYKNPYKRFAFIKVIGD